MSARATTPEDRVRPPARPARSGAGRAAAIARAAALRLAVLVAFALAWQAVTLATDSIFFPTVTEIVERFGEVVLGGQGDEPIMAHLGPSLLRLFAGWLIAAILGVAVGVAVGVSRQVNDYLDPIIQFARAIPPPALLPLFLVLLGLGNAMKISMIAFGIIWPILLNTIDGVRSVDTGYLDTGKVYGAGARDRLLRIVLPAAAPSIFAGLRVSLSIAVILMVISEMVAATNGVGFLLMQAQRTFRMLDMWAYVLLLAILGYLLNTALLSVERRVLRWHWQRRRTGAEEGAA